ncbi:putative capsular polysaccharide synthesis family protein [Alkalicoccus urumqiensis]|uniref:Sulfotransferase domain-containing protein n=1 Tax=Alkalicoccus urumqiensis TaxID=1548213 RepID=A0A2P6MGC5_ALKUR|nr:putative capsular polysaccharide synthesis family protein [Alkalicoccus urumqiensis]PRO65336.1 hypothetical protein C6I21_09230 [Alkalicoccus urumqiensis]
MLNKVRYFKKMYIDNPKLVVIHQMGKVGSTTLVETLKEKNWQPFHVHSFRTPLSTSMYEQYRSTRYYRTPLYRLRYFLRHRLVEMLLKQRKKVKIISLVREPVSRNQSMYFHAFHVPLMGMNKYQDNRQEDAVNIEAFRRDFYKRFNHLYGNRWFDQEFARIWDVNVYAYPFDQEKGYTRIQSGNKDILLVQMEKLNDLEQVLADFLGEEDLTLTQANSGSKKWYHAVYKEFKQKADPSKEYVDQLYDTKYMNHFYSKEDQEKGRNRFLRS